MPMHRRTVLSRPAVSSVAALHFAAALHLAMALCLAAVLVASPAGAGHHEEAGKTADSGKAAAAKTADDAARKAPRVPPQPDPALLQPNRANEKAPPRFKVRFETTKGDFVVAVTRRWAPNGADRFYNLVKLGFYDDVAFFRVIDGFMAQFGLHGNPRVTNKWRGATIPDDPVVESNTRGRLTFAKTGRPNSRTTQLFINFGDNANLDAQGFAPFAEVVEGMDVVDSIYKVGEGAPRGRGPAQNMIQRRGNAYLKQRYPQLDYIVRARVIE